MTVSSVTSAPPTVPTPPTAKAAGARAAHFHEALSQHVAAAQNQVAQTQAQTKIQAAQIAGKANVSLGVKHGLQLGGNHPKVTYIHPQQRFLPIHRTGPAVQSATPTQAATTTQPTQ